MGFSPETDAPKGPDDDVSVQRPEIGPPPRGKAVFAAISSVIARGPSMQINGVAHTFITAGNFTTARAFYGQLLPFMGLTIVADTANTFYCVGGRTGFGIHAPAEEYAGQRFRQGTVGLHHHCFRARERADVDEAYDFLVKIGAHIVHAPREDNPPPDTTRYCSRIRTARDWRLIMSRAKDC